MKREQSASLVKGCFQIWFCLIAKKRRSEADGPLRRQIVGNYKIIDRLGEGGMGAVYKALDLMITRDVAVTVLRPGVCQKQTNE